MPRLKSASVAHMGGVCELTYDTTGAHMVTCGADSFTKVRVGDAPFEKLRRLALPFSRQ